MQTSAASPVAVALPMQQKSAARLPLIVFLFEVFTNRCSLNGGPPRRTSRVGWRMRRHRLAFYEAPAKQIRGVKRGEGKSRACDWTVHFFEVNGDFWLEVVGVNGGVSW